MITRSLFNLPKRSTFLRMSKITTCCGLVLTVAALLLLATSPSSVQGFSYNPKSRPAVMRPLSRSASSSSSSSSWSSLCSSSSTTTTTDTDTTESKDTATEASSPLLLKRDRYVATNRFAVRPGQEPKFEQRWATRKSRLATLEGFRYFHLMRRVKLKQGSEDDGVVADDDEGAKPSTSATVVSYDGGNDAGSRAGNYVSFTIWDKKSHFSAWRKGEAFKEAHGGTSIGAFVSTLISSARTLQGAPRPAFYDALLVQSKKPDPTELPVLVDGWRQIDNDEKDNDTTKSSRLPAECFVACNQFFVSPENAVAFEQRWANRESQLSKCDGFVAFSMMRRDGRQTGHGTVALTDDEPTYVSTTIWKDVNAFQAWRQSLQFNMAHGGSSGGGSGGSKDSKKTVDKKGGETKAKGAAPPPKPLWSRPPEPIFYEGTLVITTEEGA